MQLHVPGAIHVPPLAHGVIHRAAGSGGGGTHPSCVSHMTCFDVQREMDNTTRARTCPVTPAPLRAITFTVDPHLMDNVEPLNALMIKLSHSTTENLPLKPGHPNNQDTLIKSAHIIGPHVQMTLPAAKGAPSVMNGQYPMSQQSVSTSTSQQTTAQKQTITNDCQNNSKQSLNHCQWWQDLQTHIKITPTGEQRCSVVPHECHSRDQSSYHSKHTCCPLNLG